MDDQLALAQQAATANALRQQSPGFFDSTAPEWSALGRKIGDIVDDPNYVPRQYDAQGNITNVVDLPAQEQDRIWEARRAREREQAINSAAEEAGLVFNKRVSKGPIRYGP